MSYIALDVKFLETEAPAIARASRSTEDRVVAGHARLWKLCWTTKRSEVSRVDLAGSFGPDGLEELISAAEAFTLTRVKDAETWVVRGVEKYLRISAARAEAGRKRAASAPRLAGRLTSKPPASAGGATSKQPALTPSTEHRAPSTEKDIAPAAQPPRESDLLLEDFKAATGSAYLWAGARDGKAFAQLRKVASIQEIRARWRRGLSIAESEWTSVRTVAQLAMKWNDLAESKAAAQPPKQVLRHL